MSDEELEGLSWIEGLARAELQEAESAAHRDVEARRRDELARWRDLESEARDRADEELDRVARRLIAELSELDRRTAAAHAAALAIYRKEAAAIRQRAAIERKHAAMDRAAAATDREAAVAERERLAAELERAAHDRLTGTFHRGTGDLILRRELERAKRSGGDVVIGYFDLDDLKQVNDERGHGAGDAVLVSFVEALRSSLRTYDLIVRWGGDEFVCAIPDADQKTAENRIEQVRRRLHELSPGTTFCVGLAMPGPEDTLDSIVERADDELMRAKRDRGAS